MKNPKETLDFEVENLEFGKKNLEFDLDDSLDVSLDDSIDESYDPPEIQLGKFSNNFFFYKY